MEKDIRALTLVLAALVGSTMSASTMSAQQRPDFSGVWTLAPDTTATASAAGGRGGRSGDMGSGWASPVTIKQDANRLTVEYAFFGRGDMQPPIRLAFALDGSETRNSVMMGRGIQQQRSRAVWTGDTLVLTTLHEFTSPQNDRPQTAEMRQALSLSSPTSLVIETTRVGVGGAPNNTTKSVYRKSGGL